MPVIEKVSGLEILDSRGNPTVLATCMLKGGIVASASVPSGASRGALEAHELRDGDPSRYRGKGCRKAVAVISNVVGPALGGRTFETQQELDRALIEIDGTPNKSRLGANSLLAVSMAFARAMSLWHGMPFYQFFGDMAGIAPSTLPRLTINLFSGGEHAGKQVAIQDVMLVPLRCATIDESLARTHDVYAAAARGCLERYGMRSLVADEGGLAPPFECTEAMLDLAIDSIQRAGFRPGSDFALAVDVAATHFYDGEQYVLDGSRLTSVEMIGRLCAWTERYPIISIEDGLAEEDWRYWPQLHRALKSKASVIGDDLLCTQAQRIRRARDCDACNGLLLKVNQVGTLSEALEAMRLARAAGWTITLSVRSGETEDTWAADLAVGWSADQFKNGSITRSERLSKYNRLLAIEAETGWRARSGTVSV